MDLGPQCLGAPLSYYIFPLFVVAGVVRLKDLERFMDLGPQCLGALQEVEELGVVHLKEHPSDLTGQFRLGPVDEGIQPFTDHVLLDLWRRRRQRRGCELAGSRWRDGDRYGRPSRTPGGAWGSPRPRPGIAWRAGPPRRGISGLPSELERGGAAAWRGPRPYGPGPRPRPPGGPRPRPGGGTRPGCGTPGPYPPWGPRSIPGWPGTPPPWWAPPGPPAPPPRLCCASSCARRTSRRWASATKMGLPPTIFPFISLTALVESSGLAKHTKPKPREIPVLWSRMTRALVMVPRAANSRRSSSSPTASPRFLT